MSPSPRSSDDDTTDADLLDRVAAQDVDAFAAFYDRHAAVAFAIALRVVGSRTRADDVCQESFLGVWRSAGRFDPDLGSARTWVSTIVHNKAIDHVRSERRARDRELRGDALCERLVAAPRDDTETSALRNAQALEVRGLLDVLGDDQREAIELAFYGGCTHVEIAERLGVPLGTVKARINRGLARMRPPLAAGARERAPRATSSRR